MKGLWSEAGLVIWSPSVRHQPGVTKHLEEVRKFKPNLLNGIRYSYFNFLKSDQQSLHFLISYQETWYDKIKGFLLHLLLVYLLTAPRIDKGNYSCAAQNSEGRSSSNLVEIKVKCEYYAKLCRFCVSTYLAPKWLNVLLNVLLQKIPSHCLRRFRIVCFLFSTSLKSYNCSLNSSCYFSLYLSIWPTCHL